MRRGIAGGVLIVLLTGLSLAACSDDDEPQASDTTVTTVASTSSTTGAGATTTGPFTSQPEQTVGEVLPDGRHFGYLQRIQEMDEGTEVVTFDLAYLYVGAAAVAAAEEDDAELDTEYYIRNNNDRTRDVDLVPDVAITIVGGSHPCCDSYPATLTELYDHMDPDPATPDIKTLPVILTIADGQVTRIDEQYFP